MQQRKPSATSPYTVVFSSLPGVVVVVHQTLSLLSLCALLSIESVFVHSNRGQGWAPEPHPIRSYSFRDHYRSSCCQDSQNTAGGGPQRGKFQSVPVSRALREVPWGNTDPNAAFCDPPDKHLMHIILQYNTIQSLHSAQNTRPWSH